MFWNQSRRKSLLEIGCGDVPLGLDLAREKQLFVFPSQQPQQQQQQQQDDNDARTTKEDDDDAATKTTHDLEHLLDRVVCCDYSVVVMRSLEEQQKDETARSAPVEYVVRDARNLPYDDGTFDFVLDKGTLDAMLSDKEHGVRLNVRDPVRSYRHVLHDTYLLFLLSFYSSSSRPCIILLLAILLMLFMTLLTFYYFPCCYSSNLIYDITVILSFYLLLLLSCY